MNWITALIHGLIWSVIWGLPITLMEIWWPQLWVHDYPKELQKVSYFNLLREGVRRLHTSSYPFGCWL